jgi:hypothetical protein
MNMAEQKKYRICWFDKKQRELIATSDEVKYRNLGDALLKAGHDFYNDKALAKAVSVKIGDAP